MKGPPLRKHLGRRREGTPWGLRVKEMNEGWFQEVILERKGTSGEMARQGVS